MRTVDDAAFSAERGKILAIAGESGCGRSVTAYSIQRLIRKPGRIVGGRILLHQDKTKKEAKRIAADTPTPSAEDSGSALVLPGR